MDATAPAQTADQQFLASLEWSAAAPETLVAAAEAGDFKKLGAGLKSVLQKRFRALPDWWKSRKDGLLADCHSKLVAVVESDAKPSPLKKSLPEEPCVETALAGLELIARRLRDLSDKSLTRLWLYVVQTAIGEPQSDFEPSFRTSELRWKLGLAFPELAEADELCDLGSERLLTSLMEQTDDDGIAAGSLFGNLSEWLAAITRAAAWGKWLREPLIDGPAESRYALVVARLIDISQLSGRLALDDPAAASAISVLETAARLSGIKKLEMPRRRLAWLRDPDTSKEAALKFNSKRPPSYQSDVSRVACLRSHRLPASDLITLTHETATPRLEIAAAGVAVISGQWPIEVAIDGTPINISGWDCVCWHSDADGDYCELQAQTSSRRTLRIERQVFLARKGHIVILADKIAAANGAQIRVNGHLPLCGKSRSHVAPPTREVQILGPRPGRVFPLFAPQHAVQASDATVTAPGNAIAYTDTAIGGMYLPMVFDFDPGDFQEVADWRALTVTENREVLEPQIASGYRVRIGKRQLLVYHSLRDGESPRAALGHHTAFETVIAKVKANGTVKPLLLVE